MSVAKVVEITSSSPKSFDDAVARGIDQASKTLGGIEGTWVKESKVVVENGSISEYRIDMKVTFVLNG